MTKVWPRNTLCSTPDWASKARAQASPLPVNTVDTQQYTGPFLAATSPGMGPPPAPQRHPKGQMGNIWKPSEGKLGSQSYEVREDTEGSGTPLL